MFTTHGDWRPLLVERLANAANAAGAWGYRAFSAGAAEPTALAALALAATRQAPKLVPRALDWLAGLQQGDGAVPITANAPSPHWPTPLALLAWLHGAPQSGQVHVAEVQNATDWLIDTRGRKVARDSEVHGHDTTLVGWPWVSGSHSWLEPTAYALLALRAVGKANHPRVREGVRMILDRALPAGGWNYGNRRVLAHVLRPFPATTGLALAALSGETRDTRIDAAVEYLRGELARVRVPLSLAWGLIGLRAWNAQPPLAQQWLAECAERLLIRPANPHYDALLLLAGADSCPLIARPEGSADD